MPTNVNGATKVHYCSMALPLHLKSCLYCIEVIDSLVAGLLGQTPTQYYLIRNRLAMVVIR